MPHAFVYSIIPGPLEREYELLIRSTLESVVPLAQHPRTSIMVVLQVCVCARHTITHMLYASRTQDYIAMRASNSAAGYACWTLLHACEQGEDRRVCSLFQRAVVLVYYCYWIVHNTACSILHI